MRLPYWIEVLVDCFKQGRPEISIDEYDVPVLLKGRELIDGKPRERTTTKWKHADRGE
tara:strand:+ start:745 stop:918 length:174 start_codon:yes stop_codon:yes gene_type:complete